MCTVCDVLLSVFQCTPVRKAWNPGLPGTCINASVAAIVMGGINAVMDFIVVFLPVPLICKLHMQRRWKFQILGIMLLSGS